MPSPNNGVVSNLHNMGNNIQHISTKLYYSNLQKQVVSILPPFLSIPELRNTISKNV